MIILHYLELCHPTPPPGFLGPPRETYPAVCFRGEIFQKSTIPGSGSGLAKALLEGPPASQAFIVSQCLWLSAGVGLLQP